MKEVSMRRGLSFLFPLLLVAALQAPGQLARAEEPDRFFVMGTGELRIYSTKSSHRFAGRYRSRDGRYHDAALRQINRVFGADLDADGGRVSLRLIELLSRVRADLKGGWVVIASGYRGPRYNMEIRDRGGTVALSSLHQYGMAADLRLTGVQSKKIWELARERKLGGAGCYNGPWVHLDVGQPRFWTQVTANVRKERSVNNKLVQLVPWFDIYRPGEVLQLRFVRMTAFPMGVQPRFVLEREGKGVSWSPSRTFTPGLGRKVTDRCPSFDSIAAMSRIRWQLPADLEAGRYRVHARFCNRKWSEMREETFSRPIQVVDARVSHRK